MRTWMLSRVQVIGVNNRNLHTFEVDMGTTERLARMIPLGADVLLAALSGIASRAKSPTPDHRSQPTPSATPVGHPVGHPVCQR